MSTLGATHTEARGCFGAGGPQNSSVCHTSGTKEQQRGRARQRAHLTCSQLACGAEGLEHLAELHGDVCVSVQLHLPFHKQLHRVCLTTDHCEEGRLVPH